MWKQYLEERKTKRLLIRPLIINDYLNWQEFIMNESATFFFPEDWKLKPEKSLEWINYQLTRYEENRYGLHALIERESGCFIGQCGLLSQIIDGNNELEIAYHLIPRFWGKGYASEAASVFKTLCFENNLADSVISIVDTKNIPSQKVAERNGMTQRATTRFMGMETFIYRINKNEYLSNSL